MTTQPTDCEFGVVLLFLFMEAFTTDTSTIPCVKLCVHCLVLGVGKWDLRAQHRGI